MKITFLGTGAADWPTEKPKETAEFRRLSSALIDGVLLIDPGPQVLEALNELGIDPGQIQYIINTHRHSDHFCIETLEALESFGAVFVECFADDKKRIGNYNILALKGNHATCEDTVHFIISAQGKNRFSGSDVSLALPIPFLLEKSYFIPKPTPAYHVIVVIYYCFSIYPVIEIIS